MKSVKVDQQHGETSVKKAKKRKLHDGDGDVEPSVKPEALKSGKKSTLESILTDVKEKKTKLAVKQPKTLTDSDKKKPKKMLHADAKKLKLTGNKTMKKTVTAAKKNVSTGDGKNKKPKLEEMKKKDRKKLRKSQNEHFDTSTKAKAMWEEYRRSDLTPERKVACGEELLKIIKGNCQSLVFAHDTSRVIQWLMKRGSAPQKEVVFLELKDQLLEIMKSKYAKNFITNLLKYGNKPMKDSVFAAMHGKLRKLVRHRESVAVVERAYNMCANSAQRSAMAADFYGKTFTVFKSNEERTLQAFVATHPDKRDDVVTFLKDSLAPLADKSLLQHSFIHRLFLDFFTCANETQRSEMIETLREQVVHMLHTHDGARIAMMCLWYGTAKDRKVIIKSFKTYVVKISLEEFGHMVLLALFDVVDDTKIVQKAILDELLQSVDEVVRDRYGRKVLFYLLLARDPLHFHPDVVALLKPGDGNQHSKKDASIRQHELLVHVSTPLLHYITANCQQLMADDETQLLALSAVKHCTGDSSSAMRAVCELVAEPFEPKTNHAIEQTSWHLVLKRLILNDNERVKQSPQPVLFSSVLLDVVPTETLLSWTACNRGCFVLVSLLEVKSVAVNDRLRRLLTPVKHKLQTLKTKGADILYNKLDTDTNMDVND